MKTRQWFVTVGPENVLKFKFANLHKVLIIIFDNIQRRKGKKTIKEIKHSLTHLLTHHICIFVCEGGMFFIFFVWLFRTLSLFKVATLIIPASITFILPLFK